MSAPALPRLEPGKTADVIVLLEGTYPYVQGGVSSWIHQIIRGTPDRTFALVFLGGSRASYGAAKYTLPDNVVHLEAHYLMDSWQEGTRKPRAGDRKSFAAMRELHDAFRDRAAKLPEERMRAALSVLERPGGITQEDFLYSERSWEEIADRYQRFCTDPSFVDYFWTVRTMHAPLFHLARIARAAPRGRMIHAISTGYAGFLGVLLREATGRPLLLTEHGIYTKERKIDLSQAEWIADGQDAFESGLRDEASYIRQMWIRFFESIGRLVYAAADPIVALYEGNRQRQIADGADGSRCVVVPNGIDVDRLSKLRDKRAPGVPKRVGLIGRVTPIKDVKTFLRAMRTVVTQMPDVEGWVVGPEDEDKQYVKECKELAYGLGLERHVTFKGFQKLDDVLPQLGLIVLTSISEAQPLVILEGFAAGVPSVATDVGCCRELIEGMGADDRALGVAGRVVSIADPQATAAAIVETFASDARWQELQRVGIARVEKSYTQALMLQRYRDLYRRGTEA